MDIIFILLFKGLKNTLYIMPPHIQISQIQINYNKVSRLLHLLTLNFISSINSNTLQLTPKFLNPNSFINNLQIPFHTPSNNLPPPPPITIPLRSTLQALNLPFKHPTVQVMDTPLPRLFLNHLLNNLFLYIVVDL